MLKLSAYPSQNGLAIVLRDYGRLVRSTHILQWYRSLDLRKRTQASLTKANPSMR